MSNCTVVGYIQNYDKPQIWNWAMSLKRHFTGDVVVLATGLSADTYQWLKGLGFTVYTHGPESSAAVVTRFLYLWKLIEMGKVKTPWVMMSDVKDVIFQTDLEEQCTLSSPTIMAGGENVTYENEAWGRDNLKRSFPYVYDSLKNQEILNAGTFCGTVKEVSDLCQFVYHMSLNNPVHNPDQAALNVVLRSRPFQDIVMVKPITSNYAIQLGTSFDPTKKIPQIRPIDAITFDGGIVENESGLPYCIVHQYDRNFALNSAITERFKNG